MSDLATGAISAGGSTAGGSPAGGNQGGSSTGGRAASAAPSVSQDNLLDSYEQELTAQTNRRMAQEAGQEQDRTTDADDAGDDEGWPDEGAELEPTEEDKYDRLQKAHDELDRRFKGMQGALQQAIERERQWQAQAQQHQVQQVMNQITPAEQQWQADLFAFQARQEYMTPAEAQAQYAALQQRAQVLQQARQNRLREAQLAQREARIAPQARANDLTRLQESYKYHYGIDIPAASLNRAKNWEHAVLIAHSYAEGQLSSRDQARAQANGSTSRGSGGERRGAASNPPAVRGNNQPDRWGKKKGSDVLTDYFEKSRREIRAKY